MLEFPDCSGQRKVVLKDQFCATTVGLLQSLISAYSFVIQFVTTISNICSSLTLLNIVGVRLNSSLLL